MTVKEFVDVIQNFSNKDLCTASESLRKETIDGWMFANTTTYLKAEKFPYFGNNGLSFEMETEYNLFNDYDKRNFESFSDSCE